MQDPFFVSQQVTAARRYYLDLNPSPQRSFGLVCGGVERMKSEYVVRRNDFPYFAVEMVVEGEGILELNGRRFALQAGVVFAYGPGVTHTIRTHPERRMRKYYIDFAGSEAFTLLSNAGLGEWKPLNVTAVHTLIPIFESIEKESSADSPLAQAVCETLGRLLLLKIQEHTVPGRGSVPQSFRTYERLRAHIEAHYLRLHSVEDAAGECGVTPVHLSRLFGRFAQSGAYQFLIRLKMNHAAGLLENGCSVKEAGALLGFADAFQFSRAFKRVHGVPPVKFKEARFGTVL